MNISPRPQFFGLDFSFDPKELMNEFIELCECVDYFNE
jgi:hypothetical protein